MRRLIGVLVAVALILGLLALGDVWVRHRVQTRMAEHIQSRVPGSTASVHITSFPFLGRLAVSGKVPELDARVRGVSAFGLDFSTINVVVHGLEVDNSKLFSREVILQGIDSGSVVGDIPQSSIDRLTGLSVGLGSGTVEVAGVTLTPSVSVTGGAIVVTLPHLPEIRLPIPELPLLPCVGSVAIIPGALRLSCQLTQLPPALANA
ncbi:MAG: LmeA family phospholipid-binding protein, partial [Acidimicrobiaceae bacterium]|nr:LmeA family phospholipid-binding protein [Acidimicrobiaceae bacterium]